MNTKILRRFVEKHLSDSVCPTRNSEGSTAMDRGDLLMTAVYLAGVVVLLRLLLSLKTITFLIGRCWRWMDERAHVYQRFFIPRYLDEEGINENPLYRKAAAYVSALPTLEDSEEIDLLSSGRDLSLRLTAGQIAADYYLGARLLWESRPTGGGGCLVLRLRRQDRRRALRPYLQHVEAVAAEIELSRRELRLFTHFASNGGGDRLWRSTAMIQPATMETVAMEAALKARIRADLEAFIKGRGFYRRVGRVWRRSYLLEGPPGTGKTSFVAAMARFLCYDIYDLDLYRVRNTDELRLLLLRTTPRSVILVEDFDRHGEVVSLLGLMDAVFCCCGEERVVVYTTDGGGDAADTAVLRPGRVDMRVNFPLCDFTAFKTLSSSYLGVRDHKLYAQVEEGFQNGVTKLSTAEVGEIMTANRSSPSRAIRSVVSKLSACERPLAMVAGKNNGRGEEQFPCETDGDENSNSGFGKEATIREFKKIYGFIRRTTSKRDGVMTVEAAGAAAANANAVERRKEA